LFKLISKSINLYVYIYIFLYKFSKKYLLSLFYDLDFLKKINKKKNLFFKKKFKVKTLISKRISIILRKRKKFKSLKPKKVDKGNFFFKKFFFKTLLKSRKFLKSFFFFNLKIRQLKVTKSISDFSKNNYFNNSTCEYTVLNILLRSHICLFVADSLKLIKLNFIFLNGVINCNPQTLLTTGDYIQLRISTTLYKYILFSKKLLKKKLALFRLNSWKFFKQKFFKQKQQLKLKKRKSPKFLYLFYLFRLDTPKFLEVDYFTLSVFFLKKLSAFSHTTYFLNKMFSFKLFPLYNFKKIN
jgi:hypothetical protein